MSSGVCVKWVGYSSGGKQGMFDNMLLVSSPYKQVSCMKASDCTSAPPGQGIVEISIASALGLLEGGMNARFRSSSRDCLSPPITATRLPDGDIVRIGTFVLSISSLPIAS